MKNEPRSAKLAELTERSDVTCAKASTGEVGTAIHRPEGGEKEARLKAVFENANEVCSFIIHYQLSIIN